MGTQFYLVDVVAVAHVDTTCQVSDVLSKFIQSYQAAQESDTWGQEVRHKTSTGIRIGKGDMMTIA